MPIVEEKPVMLVARKGFAELLQCPLSRRMFGGVEVNEPSRSDLECDKDIKDTEAHCYGNEEIASHHAVGVIAEKSRPPLILRSTRSGQLFDVLAHSSR